MQTTTEAKNLRLELYCLGDSRATLGAQPLTLTRRQFETLALLALNPAGLSSADLALELYGDRQKSVKALLSRLRRKVPLASQPYRLLNVDADFLKLRRSLFAGQLNKAAELYGGELLPWSHAPGIREERAFLEAGLKEAVLHAQSPETLFHLCKTVDQDLELWEELTATLPASDPRLPFAAAKVRHMQATWAC